MANNDAIDLSSATASNRQRERFEELFEQVRPDVKQFIENRLSQKLRRRIDASDILQETHLVAFQRFEDFRRRRPMPVHIWLLKTARQQLVQAVRKHLQAECRTILREEAWPDQTSVVLANSLMAKQSTPSKHISRKEIRQKFSEALASLTDDDRELLLLRQVENRPYDDISLILEMDAAALRKRYGRVLLRLRKALSRVGVLDASP